MDKKSASVVVASKEQNTHGREMFILFPGKASTEQRSSVYECLPRPASRNNGTVLSSKKKHLYTVKESGYKKWDCSLQQLNGMIDLKF